MIKKISNIFFFAVIAQLLFVACAPSAAEIEAEKKARTRAARQRIDDGLRNQDPYAAKGIYNRE